jgi:ABC-type multidrug transport system ATPase subunit
LGNERYTFWAEGIGKSFGGTVVLKAASIWAEPGKVTTLMGRNGSGKTTLFRIAAGLLRADHGVVSLFGEVTEHASLHALARRGLMFLPQGRLASPMFTARDHFRALGSVFGFDGIESAISVAALEELLDQPIASLSGGERARVSLGLAFARRPRVLLADEPLVGLAPADQEYLGGMLRALAAEGTAVVTSGHDTSILLSVSDVILWSVAGTTHHIGSPTEATAHEQFRREYLGPRFLAG